MDHPFVTLKETTEPVRRTPPRYTALLADYWSRKILRSIGMGLGILLIAVLFFGAIPLIAWLVPATLWLLFGLLVLAPAAYAGWATGDSLGEKIFLSVACMAIMAAGVAYLFSLAV
jgi:hypothetical protein